MFSESGWRWWLLDEAAKQPARMLDRFLWKKEADGITLLSEKALKARRAYRLALSDCSGTSLYFAKQMALVSRKRLGGLLGGSNLLVGFNHGTAELAHNLALHERTIHGVQTFAFGEYFRYGLPVQQILLQEYLTDWQPFDAVWRESGDAASREVLLRKLADMLEAFRDARIQHLDLHPCNVLVSPVPEAPLRAIDCGKMSAQADPAISAALHLGVFLYELNGKCIEPQFEVSTQNAQRLFRDLVGNEPGFATAEGLLLLLLRYSTKRPFSRRQLVRHRHDALNLVALEKRLCKLTKGRYGVASIDP